jgi:ACR3 family arsenite efflux pump ArsB
VEQRRAWAVAQGARRLILWLLGAVLILDSITSTTQAVPELIVGLIMVGVLPLEDVIMTYARARGLADRGQ